MPRFLPFRALRYADVEHLATLVAPPYDVLSDAEVDHYLALDEHNITTSTCPAVATTATGSRPKLWRRGATRGCWSSTTGPSFTLYRLQLHRRDGHAREIAGVLGGLEVVDEGAGGVLPHERTTPKASTDRLDLTRATGANLSPVWGLSLASGLAGRWPSRASCSAEVVEDGVDARGRAGDRSRPDRGHPARRSPPTTC